MSVSVVVPVHNEAGNVEDLMAEIHQALVGQSTYEMIFVDDGSTDDTLPILKQNLPTYPALRILTHRQACGQSRAIHTGVVAARFDWVATLDGDGQNDPTDIPALIDELVRRNNDQLWMLAGFRHRRNDTGWRRFSSKLANAVRQAILHDQTPDSGCGLKLFRRDKFLALPYFDHIHRFLPAMIRMAGGEVISVKVNHRPRSHGQSKYGTLDRLLVGVIDLPGVVWLKKRHSLPVTSEVYHER
ncbi:MAG: glycosyltransferase family 2 protein [Methylomonas sp.]|nr:glycosyltransferase family 2 protein [Methylomonas sp.]PPD19938.1 MAG: dolichol-phosphate mannosyltransferase [Methylomonas sp.]PPD25485.1 MAG: dolichol-phosphate mannosyltransferase [Methylomonas sp.]PPD36185.1 MAG: dolichol-phosphate mannosyltransferase [Methylomonas sp.]PPD39723.1 MAG: dolichol-phosphate mannosyltransferase [Methylomonas sp.]